MQNTIAKSDLGSLVITNVAGTSITLGSLVLALVVLGLSLLAARILVAGISRFRERMPGAATSLYILEKLGAYGIVIVGATFAISALGFNLSSFAVFAGALGIGVGLGLQGVVKEFVSGLVLLFDSVITVGDYIELPGAERIRGIIQEIGTRATRIRTNDNVDILVPNSRLIEDRFVNWTLKGQTRRIHVPFSVAYGADKTMVRNVVIAAAKALPFTLPDDRVRSTQVWLVGFGESALNFELLVWPALSAVKRPASTHAAYTWAIDDALRDAGLEIPFPQRDIHIVDTRDNFTREASALDGQPAARSNDAAEDVALQDE
jgi:small-conductance mechanosensitive channel